MPAILLVTIDLSFTLHIAWQSELFVLHSSPFLQDFLTDS